MKKLATLFLATTFTIPFAPATYHGNLEARVTSESKDIQVPIARESETTGSKFSVDAPELIILPQRNPKAVKALEAKLKRIDYTDILTGGVKQAETEKQCYRLQCKVWVAASSSKKHQFAQVYVNGVPISFPIMKKGKIPITTGKKNSTPNIDTRFDFARIYHQNSSQEGDIIQLSIPAALITMKIGEI